MSLPLIRADWAQHMVYGAWVGAAGAVGVLVLGMAAGRPGIYMLAPAACICTALLAGLAKEASDWLANCRAGEPVHEVSAADVLATVAGALPVAVPLFMMMWG